MIFFFQEHVNILVRFIFFFSAVRNLQNVESQFFAFGYRKTFLAPFFFPCTSVFSLYIMMMILSKKKIFLSPYRKLLISPPPFHHFLFCFIVYDRELIFANVAVEIYTHLHFFNREYKFYLRFSYRAYSFPFFFLGGVESPESPST